MSVGNWFLELIKGVIVDALFKRPINITVDRKSDGSWNTAAKISPSNAPQQTTHVYYGNPYQPYPLPGVPPGSQQYAAPPSSGSNPNQPPESHPQPPPRELPTDHIPKDFLAS